MVKRFTTIIRSGAVWSLGLLSLGAGLAFAQSGSSGQFIGMWKLVELKGERPTTGAVNAVSDQPSGTIIYDANGHVAVQILYKQGRAKFAKGPSAGTPEEKASAFDSYTAYWGTYTVDAKAGTVTHHIEGALNPSNAGKDNLRYYEIKGNRLTLTNPDDGKGGFKDKKDTSRQLVWEKVVR